MLMRQHTHTHVYCCYSLYCIYYTTKKVLAELTNPSANHHYLWFILSFLISHISSSYRVQYVYLSVLAGKWFVTNKSGAAWLVSIVHWSSLPQVGASFCVARSVDCRSGARRTDEPRLTSLDQDTCWTISAVARRGCPCAIQTPLVAA